MKKYCDHCDSKKLLEPRYATKREQIKFNCIVVQECKNCGEIYVASANTVWKVWEELADERQEHTRKPVTFGIVWAMAIAAFTVAIGGLFALIWSIISNL